MKERINGQDDWVDIMRSTTVITSKNVLRAIIPVRQEIGTSFCTEWGGYSRFGRLETFCMRTLRWIRVKDGSI